NAERDVTTAGLSSAVSRITSIQVPTASAEGKATYSFGYGYASLGSTSNGPVPVLTNLALPHSLTYGFTYVSSLISDDKNVALLSSVALPTGGSIAYTYGEVDLFTRPSDGCVPAPPNFCGGYI